MMHTVYLGDDHIVVSEERRIPCVTLRYESVGGSVTTIGIEAAEAVRAAGVLLAEVERGHTATVILASLVRDERYELVMCASEARRVSGLLSAHAERVRGYMGERIAERARIDGGVW